MNRIQFALASIALSLISTGCASTDDGDDGGAWAEIEVNAPSVEVLWQVTRLALQRENLPVQNRFNDLNHTTTTGWHVSLAPFKGDGFRERAKVRFETLGPGEFELAARVIRETNECLARPLDISYAEWESADDNEARAKILLQRIRAYLGDDVEFEVGSKPKPFN